MKPRESPQEQKVEYPGEKRASSPKRFRILKLEERIAPKSVKKGETGVCTGKDCCFGDGSAW